MIMQQNIYDMYVIQKERDTGIRQSTWFSLHFSYCYWGHGTCDFFLLLCNTFYLQLSL